MRHQRKNYWCGVAAIANALEVLGIRRTQREVAKLCHVTPEAGTSEVEMKRALLANGVAVDEWSEKDEHTSRCWLFEHIRYLGPVVLCVDQDEHWVTAIGWCAGRVVLFDPSRNSGVEVRDDVLLAERWVNADGVYYGLGVSLL